jgi:Tol biopolymer transport system component
MESNIQYSPDGKSIVFASDRSGNLEIWMCASDGSNTFQLTSLGEPETGSPHWSPDGQYIVCDSRHGGNADIYIIKATGGQPRRLTTDSRGRYSLLVARWAIDLFFLEAQRRLANLEDASGRR